VYSRTVELLRVQPYCRALKITAVEYLLVQYGW
jgi:hypothetical protein